MKSSPGSISVVIPVWNQAMHLEKALLSVLGQLQRHDEVIVIDDNSPEGLPREVVKGYDHRIMWLRHTERRGVSAARNFGIRRSQAEWIKFLDADDLLAPFALNGLRQAVAKLSHEVHIITGGMHRIVDHQYDDYLRNSLERINKLMKTNPMLPSATMARRRALLDVGLFDDRIDFEQDWEMWLRLHERYGIGSFAVIDQPVAYYWIDTEERRQKRRTKKIDGLPVREYLRRRYGANPSEDKRVEV